jgi:hypothetical protein
MSVFDFAKRPISSFRDWLEIQNPGQSEHFAALEDLTRKLCNAPIVDLSPPQASIRRMWTGASIAAVEICNLESLNMVVQTKRRSLTSAGLSPPPPFMRPAHS